MKPDSTSEGPRAEKRPVWDPPSLKAILAGVVLLATAGGAVQTIIGWPGWVLVVLAPVAALVATAAFTNLPGRVRLWAALAATLLAVAVYVVANAPGKELLGTVIQGFRGTRESTRDAIEEASPGLDIRQLATDGRDLWGVVGVASVIEIETEKMKPIGASRPLGRRVEQAQVCSGHLVATFTGGHIAVIDGDARLNVRPTRYGDPVESGARDGMFACGENSVFVAMPLEADVVPLSLPELRLSRSIPVGQVVTALGFADSVLYSADSAQNAVITVNVPKRLPWRWISTLDAPDRVLGLREGGAIVSHDGSPCLGRVIQGAGREVGLGWSVKRGARLAAVGDDHGVFLDEDGWLHRFDSGDGSRTGGVLALKHAEDVTSLAVLDNGDVVAALPVSRMLVVIHPEAWDDAKDVGPPDPSCPGG